MQYEQKLVRIAVIAIITTIALSLVLGCKKKDDDPIYIPPPGNHHPRVSRLYLNDQTYFYPDSARCPSLEDPEYHMFTSETLSIGWKIEDEDGDVTDGYVSFYDWGGPSVDGYLESVDNPPFEIVRYHAPDSISSAPWGVYLILYVTDDQGGGDSVGIQLYIYNP